MKKRTVYIMCGPAGSGKSTAANLIAANYDAEIFSSDDMRKLLYGDEATQGDPNEVFRNLYAAARASIKDGHNVVIDATSIGRKIRKRCMSNFDDVDFVAVWVKTSLQNALAQNAARSRQVPESVIRKQFRTFIPPTLDEGFKDIIVIER